MAKLFPPIVEETIPAFCSKGKGMVITIPFSMNRAVNKNSIKGFAIKIKTLQSSSYFYSLTSLDANTQNNLAYDLINYSVSLTITDENILSKFKSGQFYKFQIAYIDLNDDIGYYSTVTIGKYTNYPEVSIANLVKGTINAHIYYYEGCYQNTDSTESVYSYYFNIYDSSNNIFYTSNEQLHNSNNDSELNTSIDSIYIPLDLLPKNIYYIEYVVKTINNLEVKSSKYTIQQATLIKMDSEKPKLIARISNKGRDNGYISLLFGTQDDKVGFIHNNTPGNFVIYRSDETSNFCQWEECYKFSNFNNNNNLEVWKDFTVESGKKYKYAISQYDDDGVHSEKVICNEEVSIDFEDIFLYDGKRQLKIRFNPKVSSFKQNNLEAKIETIGSQHPFIVRNGKVSYKEFPISGLISYLADENQLFLQSTTEEIQSIRSTDAKSTQLSIFQKDFNFSTDLVSSNIIKEKEFKIEVLNWLTNGEPKLFRSSTEGNFIVRLLNVSLTPIDTLGRMLHTFNCTAYEIAENTYENMCKLNMIIKDHTVEQYNMYWKTIKLYNQQININILPTIAQTISFTDMMPGDKIRITLEDGTSQEISIGATGTYELKKQIPIISVVLLNKVFFGLMTYSFKEKQINQFNKYSNTEIITVPARQFINLYDNDEDLQSNNEYLHIGRELTKINSSTVETKKISLNEIFYIKLYTYRSGNKRNKIDNTAILGETIIEIFDNDVFYTELPVWGTWDNENPPNIQIGKNVILEIGYSLKNDTFQIEQYEIYKINEFYRKYQLANKNLEDLYQIIEKDTRTNQNQTIRTQYNNQIKTCLENRAMAYNNYIISVNNGLDQHKNIIGERGV